MQQNSCLSCVKICQLEMVSGKRVKNHREVCGGVEYYSDTMVGRLCRLIFIRQVINPFGFVRIKFFHFLALH